MKARKNRQVICICARFTMSRWLMIFKRSSAGREVNWIEVRDTSDSVVVFSLIFFSILEVSGKRQSFWRFSLSYATIVGTHLYFDLLCSGTFLSKARRRLHMPLAFLFSWGVSGWKRENVNRLEGINKSCRCLWRRGFCWGIIWLLIEGGDKPDIYTQNELPVSQWELQLEALIQEVRAGKRSWVCHIRKVVYRR